MRLNPVAVTLMGVEVSHLVQQHPQEGVGVEVAVDADFVERVTQLWPAVVTQFRVPFACDVQVYIVLLNEVERWVDSLGREVSTKGAFILLNCRWVHRHVAGW